MEKKKNWHILVISVGSGFYFLQSLSESSRADWSRSMVYESIDHGNEVTCQAVPVVLFLGFGKKKCYGKIQIDHNFPWSTLL